MHFSALAVLACALVATAAPAPGHDHDGSLIYLDAPVNVKNVGNGNTVEILDNILRAKRGLVDVTAPVDVSNVGNYNIVDILNKVGDKRGLINIDLPINISNILNCNSISVANNILNGLAAELGCLVAELLITVEDILDCHDERRAHELLSQAADNASKVQSEKRHDDGSLLDLDAPIDISDILNDNEIEILNNVLNGHGKRGLINIDVPITITNILNCNTIEIANHILDGLASALGCLVAELLITVDDILGCHDEWRAQELLSQAEANASHHSKRHGDDDDSLIDIFAPVTVKDVGNENHVGILNNVL